MSAIDTFRGEGQRRGQTNQECIMVHLFLIAACVLASLPAFMPEKRWLFADLFLFFLAEAGLVATVLIELNSPIVAGSLNAIMLPVLPVIPAIIFAVALGFRLMAYLVRNIYFKRSHGS